MGNLFLSGFRFKEEQVITKNLAGDKISIKFNLIFPKWNCEYESWHNIEVYRLEIPFSCDIFDGMIVKKIWIELNIKLTVYENEKKYKISLDENWYRLFNDDLELDSKSNVCVKTILDNMKVQFKENIEPVFLNEFALIESKMSVVDALC